MLPEIGKVVLIISEKTKKTSYRIGMRLIEPIDDSGYHIAILEFVKGEKVWKQTLFDKSYSLIYEYIS